MMSVIMSLPSESSVCVLFLCTGNSCRSQMAEGFLRQMSVGVSGGMPGAVIESVSAGSCPSESVHRLAIEVMSELGIDISGQRSKSIDEFLDPAGTMPDVVISVCDSAAAECPVFPGREVERLHWPLDDPAAASGTEEQKRDVFRRVRDEVRLLIEEYWDGGQGGACGEPVP